ncbi:MAG TPA: acyltransferase [Kribbella sp.]
MTGLTSVEQGAALSHPRPEILALTGLRGLAAVAVVASEVGVWRTAPAVLKDLVAAGALGVPFFFLLSGFVLAYNYPTLSLRSGRRALARFGTARVARLAPLSLVIGVGVLVLGEVNGMDWVWTVFAAQVWFVGALVLMYCAYPLLARAVPGSPGKALTVALGIEVAVLGLRLAAGSGADVWLYRNPLAWVPVFVIGMALARFVGLRPPARTAYLVQAGAAFYAVVVIVLFGSSSAVQYGAVWCVPLGAVILSVATAPATPTSSLLAGETLVRLGVISFPLYLLHTIVADGFGSPLSGSLSYALLAVFWIGVAILIAEGTHRYLGVPSRRWLMNLARRVDRRAASVEA